MSRLTEWMDRQWYRSYAHRWDDSLFREWVVRGLTGSDRLLDVGAGRGGKQEMDFRGLCGLVAGADVDLAVLRNPAIDVAKLIQYPDYHLPFEDASFDVVVSNCVIEHLDDAHVTFAEVYRVLRPGGRFYVKTPNRRHYVAFFARWTPHWFHVFFNRLRGTVAHDVFPTTYTCNTLPELRSMAEYTGFKVSRLVGIEGRPEYLRITALSYILGMMFERIVNSWTSLEGLRCVLLGEFEKGIDP